MSDTINTPNFSNPFKPIDTLCNYKAFFLSRIPIHHQSTFSAKLIKFCISSYLLTPLKQIFMLQILRILIYNRLYCSLHRTHHLINHRLKTLTYRSIQNIRRQIPNRIRDATSNQKPTNFFSKMITVVT